MSPSDNGIPFLTKGLAKAFFDLDLSGNGGPSTSSTTPKPQRGRQSPVAPPLRAANQGTGNKRATFLTLPVEIRLPIYDQLLVSRFDRSENPSWAVGRTDQKLVLLGMIQAPQYRTMEPGILQTCKQVYLEAYATLYSQNVFHISQPEDMFRLMAQIGVRNLKKIKTLHVWVPWSAEVSPWLRLLHVLAEEASGLRCIELAWDADLDGRGGRGLGDNSDFVRALGKIQGLETLVIAGYYAKNWPAYLEAETGVPVRAACGHCREEPESREDLSDDELEEEESMRQAFREYQQGTEGLFP